MTSLSSRGKKQRLLGVFARTGGESSCTRPFDSFPGHVQERIRRQAEPQEGEELILASYCDEDNWVLLTSAHLVAKQASLTTRLKWSEISDATLDLNEAQRVLALDQAGKLRLRRLVVLRNGGERLRLMLEPGPSFVAFWNVLKTVSAMTAVR